MKSHARVAIIGGGISGASLLFHLTELGWTDVVLIEKNELTAGSTWHAAGLCTHFAHSPTITFMRATSIAYYKQFDDVDFHPVGAMRVTRFEDRMDEFRHAVDVTRIAGHELRIITPDEIRELHPLTQTEGLIGGIHEPNDGHVDPSQATHAFARRARAKGAEVYRHNPVKGLTQHPDGSWDVVTRDGTIRAEIVVNCAGTWAREIGTMMGIELPIVPMLHQYVVTDMIEAVENRSGELPIIRDPDESWYVRQERGGLIIGPYERPGTPWAVDGVPPEFGMDLLPPALERIETIVEGAMNRIPALQEAGIKTIVNGPITFTPDSNTMLGPAFGLRNAWMLTGTSMGVMEGGGAGRLLAEWMVEGAPSMDVSIADPRRFGAYAAERDYRVAKTTECFEHQFGIHYPFEERPAGRPVLTTPVYDELAKKDAVFGFVYGWERPNWYATPSVPADQRLTFRRPGWHGAVADECRAVRERAGLLELTAFSKFEVTGPDAGALMDRLGANRPPAADGRVGLTHALTPAGGVDGEFTVTRLGPDRYYLVAAAGARRHHHDLLRNLVQEREGVAVSDVTEDRGVLAVMGPAARDILQPLADADLATPAFPWLGAREIVLAGVPVLALRVSYVGELGWELHHALGDQRALYDAIVGQGSAHGMAHVGVYAMNSLRLEKAYRAWGLDLTIEKTPYDASLDFLVRAEGRDFTGREAMLRRRDKGPRWRMALLEVDVADADAFGLHPVFLASEMVGVVSSGAFGHWTGKSLALAYLPAELGDDADLAVGILQDHRPARVLAEPPHDPANERLRA